MATIEKQFDFTGRRVLVTGGGRGIGKETVQQFVKLRATVIVLDKDQDVLDALKGELPEVIVIKVDLTDWEGVEEAILPILPVHHLVNNAGVYYKSTTLLSVQEEDFDSIFNVNLKAVIRVSQLVCRGIVEGKLEGATVVNLSSVAATATIKGPMIYGASKACVDHLTKSMALELAPYKVRVNCIRPGMVNTEMVRNFTIEDKERSLARGFRRQVYHRDLLEAETIAKQVIYLSSPMSDMITGTGITVDAGYSLV